MEQAKVKMKELEQRLHETGVVDIKFFKDKNYSNLSPLEQARELCEVVECMLDGRYSPAAPLGDSVRGLLGGGEPSSPITFSPVVRCGGASATGDHNEEQQKSRTTAS